MRRQISHVPPLHQPHDGHVTPGVDASPPVAYVLPRWHGSAPCNTCGDDEMMFRTLTRATLAAALALGALATSATAELLETRLAALLGQERAAIGMVPHSRLSALTAPPTPVARKVATAEGTIAYDSAFLADQPGADGGAQWECLTEALYFEARGETVRGMFAVGEVILNRVDSARFPDDVCAVVTQGTGQLYACQFTFTCDGSPETVHEPQAWATVGKVARLLMDGTAPGDLTNGATYYHTRAVSPRWARVFPRTTTIGSHHFYRQG
ncbi:MAG: cell wall hydrolase [Salibaculum sp.]|uniref:cell wall hydrolase n=1 Tax=Salibaculum sp. TaxID=2855480 RepID=UPI00286FB436|nr:cell wall hydrolase [Salibaculum sp.]MDR9428944.1 cell wall hydrolase [Salibaculum sp.]MDR9482548.1 cell wall hydrolase [Salibaculum sp.]